MQVKVVKIFRSFHIHDTACKLFLFSTLLVVYVNYVELPHICPVARSEQLPVLIHPPAPWLQRPRGHHHHDFHEAAEINHVISSSAGAMILDP